MKLTVWLLAKGFSEQFDGEILEITNSETKGFSPSVLCPNSPCPHPQV